MVYIFFKGKCKVPAVTHDKLLLIVRKQIWSATKLYHKEGILGHPHKIQNANSDEIKYCGFGLCPNRFAYITRPDILEKIFSKNEVCFLSDKIWSRKRKKMIKLKHPQWFSYEEKIGSISDEEFQRRMALNH